MKDLIKKICVFVTAVTLAIAASGCNTLEGAGEDIQSGGEAIEDAAD